jgi:hypothetical protein
MYAFISESNTFLVLPQEKSSKCQKEYKGIRKLNINYLKIILTSIKEWLKCKASSSQYNEILS